MYITVVIPTKNRPIDLANAIDSLLTQSRQANQLVLIDQSKNDLSKDMVAEKVLNTAIDLTYVHDETISGLIAAKSESLKYAEGDVICFLEDDIVLESNYLQEIENGFFEMPNMLGCSGIVTNVPHFSVGYRFLFDFFHQGIFKDGRQEIYLNHQNYKKLIHSRVLSGGLSAWKNEVFQKVKFDVLNGFHVMEDIEFSFRVSKFFGKRLYINPQAKLAHYFSPVNRDGIYSKNKRKMKETILFYKKHSDLQWSTVSLLWLFLGYVILSMIEVGRLLNLQPFFGIIAGLREGISAEIKY